jgi:hypothetical protein
MMSDMNFDFTSPLFRRPAGRMRLRSAAASAEASPGVGGASSRAARVEPGTTVVLAQIALACDDRPLGSPQEAQPSLPGGGTSPSHGSASSSLPSLDATPVFGDPALPEAASGVPPESASPPIASAVPLPVPSASVAPSAAATSRELDTGSAPVEVPLARSSAVHRPSSTREVVDVDSSSDDEATVPGAVASVGASPSLALTVQSGSVRGDTRQLVRWPLEAPVDRAQFVLDPEADAERWREIGRAFEEARRLRAQADALLQEKAFSRSEVTPASDNY